MGFVIPWVELPFPPAVATVDNLWGLPVWPWCELGVARWGLKRPEKFDVWRGEPPGVDACECEANIHLDCRLGVRGEPWLICPKFKAALPFTRQVSTLFLGGSASNCAVEALIPLLITSSSSSQAGLLLFLSSKRKKWLLDFRELMGIHVGWNMKEILLTWD